MASWLDRNIASRLPASSHPPVTRSAGRPENAAAGRGETARPPTVKVHIGRIRIDGPPPAAPRARFSRPKPSVPLTEYLGRRYRK